MERMKTFAKYALWIILFYIFSNILIFFYLNTSYNSLDLIGTLPDGLTIEYAEATSVNGRVRGTIVNDNEELNDKYINFRYYDDNGSLIGANSIKISDLNNNEFKFYFKLFNVDNYTVSISDLKLETSSYENDFSSEEFKGTVILGLLAVLIFM